MGKRNNFAAGHLGFATRRAARFLGSAATDWKLGMAGETVSAEPNWILGGVRVLLLLKTAVIPGRAEAELTMPSAPVPKLQLGRGGAVLVEHVRYSPEDGLYVCRCNLVRDEVAPLPSDAAGILAFLKDDTGLEWGFRGVSDA